MSASNTIISKKTRRNGPVSATASSNSRLRHPTPTVATASSLLAMVINLQVTEARSHQRRPPLLRAPRDHRALVVRVVQRLTMQHSTLSIMVAKTHTLHTVGIRIMWHTTSIISNSKLHNRVRAHRVRLPVQGRKLHHRLRVGRLLRMEDIIL